jgi:FixJ family two-component response regulator
VDKKAILLVDDEVKTLKYFLRALGSRYLVFSAASASEALQIMERREIGVIVTDQRMPESSGVELLSVVRDRYPQTARVLTTAYSDLDTLVGAINSGAVFSFVSKPWEMKELEDVLVKALDHHETLVRDELLREGRLQDLKMRFIEDRAYDVGLIAARMGHYVHNALCPVTFLMEQLLDHSNDRGVLSTEFLRNVQAHVLEVSQTLKELEQISVPLRRQAVKTLDLEKLLDSALEKTAVLRERKQMQVEKFLPAGIPLVRGVEAQIEKLFRFMLAEEVVSLPADSTVKIRFAVHEVDGEVLGVNVEFEDFVAVSPRISEESLLHPFNLRGSNPREFGIFLISCYFIVRHHGGAMSARIKGEGGVTYSFLLPAHPAESGIERFEDHPLQPGL